MEPLVFPETSVTHERYTLRDFPEEHRFHLLRGGSLKSIIIDLFGFLPLEDRTDMLSRDVSNELPLYAAKLSRRAQIPCFPLFT
jgi:hypothetical protein